MIRYHFYSQTLNPGGNITVGNFAASIIWGQTHEKFGPYCSMAVLNDDELICGVIYNNFYPENGTIELSAGSTSKRWMTKHVICAMFNMPFLIMKCQMVILRVSENNLNVLRLLRRFGCSEYYIPRIRGKNEGEVIFTLTDDQWQEHNINRNQLVLISKLENRDEWRR